MEIKMYDCLRSVMLYTWCTALLSRRAVFTLLFIDKLLN